MNLDLSGLLLFFSLLCVTQLSVVESFNWTVQTDKTTLVTKGENKSLIWEFTLTADEQTKNDLLNFVKWYKFNQLSLDYDLIGGKTFVKVLSSSTTYDEPMAPHFQVDRNSQATLFINNVRREDEGKYKIEYGIQLDGTSLAYQEFNLTVLEPPEIVNVTGDQYFCVGSMVTLSCNATGKPVPNITWTRVRENGTDSGELPSMDGFYVISNTSRGSHGTYRCTASNGVGYPANQTTKVIVANSSSVDYVVKPLNAAIEGHPYNLSCEVSGDPEPSVSWIKVSGNEHHVGKILNFLNISRNDTGNYTCEASNICGYDSKNASINVFFKPEIEQFTTTAASHTACQNDVISFNCSADAYPSVTSYQLFENNTAILDTNTSGMWSRNMSTKGVFIYKCEANNTYGTGNSENIAVHVYVPPSIQEIHNQTITEEDNLTLICLASGGPSLVVSWITPDGQPVMTNVLTLINITRNHTGEYRCEATDDCGSTSQTINVDVEFSGETTRKSNKCPEYGKMGDTLTMECPVEGNPRPNITWAPGGKSLSSNRSSITVTHQITGEHRYTCTADNGIGEPDNSTFLLVVNRYVKKEFIFMIREKNSKLTAELNDDNSEEFQKKDEEVKNKIKKVIPECHKHVVHKVELRPGSIIIYFRLSFENPMGQEALTSMLQEAVRKRLLGDVDSIEVAEYIPAKKICSGFYVDDQICKTIATLWIALIVTGVLITCAVIATIIYFVHKRRKCTRKDKRIHNETDERQASSSNHGTLSEGNPFAEVKKGYANVGPQPSVEIEQELEAVGGEATPSYALVDKSKKKGKKKDKKAAEQKQTEDQYAVVDKSKKKKKKNEPDATYAEVDMSKKSKKKPKPGEVLYADLGELHQMQKMPEASTSLKTQPLIKRPEAYAETQYADITQFLKGTPHDTGTEPLKDSTT